MPSALRTSTAKEAPPNSDATAAAASPSRSTTATAAPPSAKRRQVARPIPEAPPVTTARLPSSIPIDAEAYDRKEEWARSLSNAGTGIGGRGVEALRTAIRVNLSMGLVV